MTPDSAGADPTDIDQPDVLVLGPVSIGIGDESSVVRGQQGKVLAVLVAAYPGAVKVDLLIEALWSDSPPSTARTGLGVVLHRLRERLGGADAIVHEHTGYRLTIPARRLDLCRFQQDCDGARQSFHDGNTEAARTSLAQALDLWHGEPFQPFESDPALRLTAIELTERRGRAEDLMFEVLMATGRFDEAANWAQRLVAATPFREDRWHGLATSLYHCQRQTEALRAITEAARVMREEVGVDLGPELRELERQILDHAVPAAVIVAPASDASFATSEMVEVGSAVNRPGDPDTTYVGRDDDIEAVASLLDSHRFVTVVGMAGVGKTRLVARVIRSLPDRVVWMDLAPLGSDDVLNALANQLGVSANADSRRDRISKELASQATVVVLDNCEHLVDTAAEVARLVLASAAGSRVLANSRVAIGDAAENCFVLPSLSIHDGARLLLDRAFGDDRAAVDIAALERLVERLDANPLLLELVAEPVRTLSIEAVHEQLERVLGQSGLSSPDERHTSLAAAIDWSVRLLDAEDQDLFAALGVMRGSFSRTDVTNIVGRHATRVESQLETLCRHGLLATERGGSHTLYRQAEAVGINARHRLRAAGRAEPLLAKHADTFVALVDDAAPRLWSADEPQAVDRLRTSRSQLAATHDRLVEVGDVERAATFAISMWDYSFLRLDIEQFDWAAAVLKVDGVSDVDGYPELLGTAAMAAWAKNDFFESLRLADAAIAAADDGAAPLQALRARFNVASFQEPGLGPMEAFGELIAATIERGEPHLRCDLEVLLALGLLQIEDTDGAAESAARGMATAERTMNPSCLAWASYGLGWNQLDSDPSAGSRLFLAAARQARTVGNRFVEAMARGGLATAARRRGRPSQARVLLIEAIENWDRLQSTPQLIRACREAVLLLADMGDTDSARRGLTRLELVDLGHPLVPHDQDRFDALVAELGYLDEPDLLPGEHSVADEILTLLT